MYQEIHLVDSDTVHCYSESDELVSVDGAELKRLFLKFALCSDFTV